MGNPPTEDFVAGVHCASFESTFGTTETPLSVRAVVEGMVKCPAYPNAPVNGSFILDQDPGGCTWSATAGNQFLSWGVGAVKAFAIIDLFPASEMFFEHVILSDSFINQRTCPSSGASGGTAIITWGPEIPRL